MMGQRLLLVFCLGLIGCDVVDSTLVSGPIAGDVEADRLLNASVVVLQQQGYAVLTADRAVGLVTTDWRDESSFSDQVFLDRSYRTRVSVVVDGLDRALTVQMTKQVKDGDHPWRNHDLSGNDYRRAQTILSMIQTRAAASGVQS
jgi:uncharacterized lipoprotein